MRESAVAFKFCTTEVMILALIAICRQQVSLRLNIVFGLTSSLIALGVHFIKNSIHTVILVGAIKGLSLKTVLKVMVSTFLKWRR
jgi:hypothetical protein